MKKLILFLPVIFLIAAGCQSNTTTNNTNLQTDASANPSTQAPANQTYTNTKFGYTITYNSKWRIASKYSELLGELQIVAAYEKKSNCLTGTGDLNAQVQNLQSCLTNSPYAAQMDIDTRNFRKAWQLQTAELVIFTDLNQSDEDNFLNAVKAHTKTALDFPNGHQIGVGPYEDALTFQKETTPDSKSKIILKYFYLADGTKAYENDTRFAGFTDGGHITLSIPHNFTPSLYNGNTGKSLLFRGYITAGSTNETDFFNMVKSSKFN